MKETEKTSALDLVLYVAIALILIVTVTMAALGGLM